VRLIAWCITLPLCLGLVFGTAAHLHPLSRDELLATFTGTGWHRFVPVARLVGVAALLTAFALTVLFGLLERRTRRRQTERIAAPVDRAVS
jgi:hypothetical protein